MDVKTTIEPKACCVGLETKPVDLEVTGDLTAAFKALSDPHRVTILQVLSAAAAPVCVCDLEEHLDLSQPTVSHHLKLLLEVGLVDRTQIGRWAYYSLRSERLSELSAVLGGLSA
ncbi:MAG: ArsR/SmtB family transcription factor [Acidimicrobiia bacterium]